MQYTIVLSMLEYIHHSMLEIDDSVFETIIKSSMPTLVLFSGAWCDVCKKLVPVYENLAPKFIGYTAFSMVDVDSCPETVRKCSIDIVPTLLMFRNGIEYGRYSGVITADELALWIK